MNEPLMITLLYLTFMGNIETTRFEIHESCQAWFQRNIKVTEQKQAKIFSNHYYHEYKGKRVIGYVCRGQEPQ